MADRKFRPGTRDKRYNEGRISKNRLAWLQTALGQYVIMKYDDPEGVPEEEIIKESGPTYRLMIPRAAGGRPFYLNITAFTHEEFVEFRRLMTMMMDLAEPVILLRDKEAQDAYDRGDDSFARLHRQVPRLVVRQGAVAPDGEGVHVGPSTPPGGDAGGRDGGADADPGRVRAYGDELADRQPQEGRAQDDEPETD